MKQIRFIIAMAVCCLFSTCIGNKQQFLELAKKSLRNYYVEKDNDNLIIYSEKDTLADLMLKDGEYLSKKDELVVLSIKNYDGYYSDKVDELTSIEGSKINGFISKFKVNNEYIEVRYDSSYNIKSICKYEQLSYGAEIPDDTDKDLSLADTSYLNKQIGGVLW